jgi:hypothetical protein
MTPDPVEVTPALFGIRRRTAAVDAMTRQIEAWQAQGRAVSLVARQTLVDQAHAIDLATDYADATGRVTSLTGAHRVMLELLQGFRLVDESPPPADDEFERFLAAVRGDDAG